jgi:hypothetical protein
MRMRWPSLCWQILLYFADHDFLQVAELFFRNGLQMGQQWFADDNDARAAIVEDVFIVLRFCLRVDRNGDRPDFDGAKKGVKEFRRVQQEKQYALFRSYT